MTNWIKCSERLPEFKYGCGYCLVATSSGAVEKLSLTHQGNLAARKISVTAESGKARTLDFLNCRISTVMR